jgi:hypothetical protein
MTALPAETPATELDARLRAWFQALVEIPVPETLLRHLDQFMPVQPDSAEQG